MMTQDDRYDDDGKAGFSDHGQSSATKTSFFKAVAPEPFNRIEEEHLNMLKRAPSADEPSDARAPQRMPSPSED